MMTSDTKQCQYCDNIYKDPRILSCLHSYCLQCITKLHVENIASITCPTCNQSTTIPDEDVSSLPRNVRLNEISKQDKILRKVTSTSPPPCDSCDENTPIAYCTECDQLFCNRCWEHHQGLKKSHSHSSVTLKETQNTSRDKLIKILPSLSPMCHDHVDQKLSFYCNQCAIPVCVECTINKHKGHPVTEVSKQIIQNKEEIQQIVDAFPAVQKHLKESLTAGEEVRKTITAQKNKGDTIHEVFLTLQQLLHERKEVLLAKRSEIAMAKEVRLTIQLEGIQHLLDSISHCHSLASIATSEYSDVELLSIAHTLHNRFIKLQQQSSEISLESPNISVEVNTDTLATMITKFGCVSNTSSNDGTLLTSRKRCMSDVSLNDSVTSCKKIARVIPQRDYTKLKHPVQTITGINSPCYIAFSDNGDMFVTSNSDHCIHVYDSSGKKKTTIGSKGSGELQFQSPHGIVISGEVVYVAEWGGNRIHKLTTGGEYLGTFGQKGSDVGQFNRPWGINISPEGKVYVADIDNSRIQVFHSDWTLSHIIDAKVSGDGSFGRPYDVAFDISGDVHVTACSNSVTVFTPSGQFVRKYDQTHLKNPIGIAIDSAGYSLVMNYFSSSLSIYDPSGRFIHSIGGFSHPYGVSVSPDGSVWVADYGNYKLVKY